MSKNKIAARVDSQTVEVKTKVSGKEFLISTPYLKSHANFRTHSEMYGDLRLYFNQIFILKTLDFPRTRVFSAMLSNNVKKNSSAENKLLKSYKGYEIIEIPYIQLEIYVTYTSKLKLSRVSVDIHD